MIDPTTYTKTEIEQMFRSYLEQAEQRFHEFLPIRRRRHKREGHIHNLLEHVVGGSGVGGIVHYDYVVDASYTGTAGATITTAGGSTAKIYATLQAAITAADADNAARSIWINAGTYSEDITISATLAHSLRIVGEARDRVLIGTAGAATTSLTIATTSARIHLQNLTLRGTSGGRSLRTSVQAELWMDNVECDATFDTEGLVNSYLNKVRFDNGWLNSGVIQVVYVTDSYVYNTVTRNWPGTVERLVFDNCVFTGTSGPTFTFNGAGDIDGLIFSNCTVSASGGWQLLHINSAACSVSYLAFTDCYFLNPGATGSIYVQSCAVSEGSIIVAGNRFDPAASGLTVDDPYIVCDDGDAKGWAIVGNGFGQSGSGYVEDAGGVSVKGVFVDSVIGPNSPPDFALQADAGSSGSMYVGTGTVSGAGVSGVTALTDSLYVRLLGRPGGQTVIGGTATGNFLTMEGNSVDASSIVQVFQDAVTASTHMLRGMAGGEVGTNTAAATTTMTDTAKTWTTSQWVGAVVTCNGKTLTVTSNTATVLTGSAGWSGGGNPGAPFAYTITMTEANPRWALGFSSGALTELLLGGGGAIAPDIAFRRVSNTTMELRRLLLNAAPILRGLGSTDTQPRWQLQGGILDFGPGGSTTADTRLSRESASVFRIGLVATAGSQAGLLLPVPTTAGHRSASSASSVTIFASKEAGRGRMFAVDDVGAVSGPLGYPEGVFGNAVLAGIGGFGVDPNIGFQTLTGWGILESLELTYANRTAALSGEGWLQLRLVSTNTIGNKVGVVFPGPADTTGPQHTVVEAQPMLQIRLQPPSLADVRMFVGYSSLSLAKMVSADEPAGDSGTSTAISATTLTDSTKAWTVDEWIGCIVTAAPNYLVITSNTATVLTGAGGWQTATPTNPVAYIIAGEYVGFRFSSAVDTNWRLVAKNSAGAFTSVDTTVPPTGDVQTLQLQADTNAAALSARIFDRLRAPLAASVSTSLSNGPALQTKLRVVAALETRTGATKELWLEAGQEVIRGFDA